MVPNKTELSEPEARKILRSYSLSLKDLFPVARGTINANYVVLTDAGPLFLRINEGKSVADAAFESALIWHLGSHGVPTPPLWRTRTGTPYVLWPESRSPVAKPVMLMSWVDGCERHETEIGEAEARHVGRLLAALHLAAASFPHRRAGIYTLPHIEQRIARLSADGRAQADLGPLLGELAAEAARLSRARRSDVLCGIGHGDLFPDNLLFPARLPRGLNDGPSGFILDLEQAATMPYIYDLAVALLAFCAPMPVPETEKNAAGKARLGPLLRRTARALVAGYEELRELSAREWQGLYEELRFAALRFTVTRLTDVHGYGRTKRAEPAATRTSQMQRRELPRRFRGPATSHSKDYRDFLWRLRALAALESATLGTGLR